MRCKEVRHAQPLQRPRYERTVACVGDDGQRQPACLQRFERGNRAVERGSVGQAGAEKLIDSVIDDPVS